MKSVSHLVIGAGLQGCGISLELSKRGFPVTLVEQDPVPMNRASLRNEGKIHLGLIYAADETQKTALTQLQGALQFSTVLQSWLGRKSSSPRLSTPFLYLVAQDSLVSVENLQNHYKKLEAAFKAVLAKDPNASYLDLRGDVLARQCELEPLGKYINIKKFIASFETNERAVDTDYLATEIRRAIDIDPNIEFIPDSKVVDISELGEGFKVTLQSTNSQAQTKIHARKVFNASWNSRLEIDRFVGLEAHPGWLYRLKYRVITDLPEMARGAPSATIVLGAFGDVVIRENTAYLSWYPSGMRGWSHELAPPVEWEDVTKSCARDSKSLMVGRDIVEKTIDWYPALAGCKILSVDAGVIFAYGKTDVDDRASDLHDRSRIGVFRRGNYFSVDPGKLTTAPMFAVQAVDSALAND